MSISLKFSVFILKFISHRAKIYSPRRKILRLFAKTPSDTPHNRYYVVYTIAGRGDFCRRNAGYGIKQKK